MAYRRSRGQVRVGLAGLALGLTCALAAASPVQAQQSAAAERIAAPLPSLLSDHVRRVLGHPSLQGAQVGLIAVSLPDREVVLRHNADQLLAPASVTKLFTTAAALDTLGGHFVWETPLAYRGTRVGATIQGDLWVLGRGAPDLVEEKLWLVAQALRDDGLERVAGDLVVDSRYFDGERYGQGWPGGSQVREAYHAPVSALMANFAAVRVGNEWQSVADPAVHMGERLRHLLDVAGVLVDGIVRPPLPEEEASVPAPSFSGAELGATTVPAPLVHLYTIQSEPLGRVVLDINKFSNNVMAESLLKTLGAIQYGAPGTATKGLAVVARFLSDKIGVPLNDYVQVDGSGLSRLDRYSPEQILDLVLYAWRDFHIGPELMSSLKIGGLDGWNPAAFKQAPLLGEVRVKSGHIRGVNALAGLVHTASGGLLAFCAMVNDHGAGQWEIDQRMAEIVDALIRDY